jgi:N-methylhydantoinase A
VIIPPRPGVLSTWGLLDTDIRATFVRTVRTADRNPAALETAWAELETRARVWLEEEQVPPSGHRFERSADLRYEHQSFELTCPLAPGPVTPGSLDALRAAFHAEHRRLYTYDLPGAPIELVNLRVTAIGTLPRRAAAPSPRGDSALAAARVGTRRVYFRGAGAVDAPRYARSRLAPGMTFDGPAVVEQDDATPLVAPGFRASVDDAHNILLRRA